MWTEQLGSASWARSLDQLSAQHENKVAFFLGRNRRLRFDEAATGWNLVWKNPCSPPFIKITVSFTGSSECPLHCWNQSHCSGLLNSFCLPHGLSVYKYSVLTIVSDSFYPKLILSSGWNVYPRNVYSFYPEGRRISSWTCSVSLSTPGTLAFKVTSDEFTRLIWILEIYKLVWPLRYLFLELWPGMKLWPFYHFCWDKTSD